MLATCGITTHELWISSDLQEIERVHAAITEQLRAVKCSALDQLAARLAVEEALLNAITHGNQLQPQRLVHVVFWVDEQHIGVRIEDEGEGFDVDAVPMLAPSDWGDVPSGLGLLIIRRFMHQVAFEHGGCVVTMTRFFDL